ncbi:MAG TPA: SxtJ family membrane protein [Bryobacteraceae bacterium]|nr:SxtJ family membrane protein [Bryobacteraceae bacterium]
MASFHEDFSRESRASGPSERSFGFVFSAVCFIAAIAPLRHAKPVRVWYLVASAIFLIVATVRPALLKRPNRLWLALGRRLGQVCNPILTALLFYLVFTPAGFLLRLAGKDPLGLTLDRKAESYWNLRDLPPARGDSGMANQF